MVLASTNELLAGNGARCRERVGRVRLRLGYPRSRTPFVDLPHSRSATASTWQRSAVLLQVRVRALITKMRTYWVWWRLGVLVLSTAAVGLAVVVGSTPAAIAAVVVAACGAAVLLGLLGARVERHRLELSDLARRDSVGGTHGPPVGVPLGRRGPP